MEAKTKQACVLGGKVMERCPFIYICPFFNDLLPRGPTDRERETLKKKYCGGGSRQCARFIVAQALGLSEVPLRLFPDELYKVNVILEI